MSERWVGGAVNGDIVGYVVYIQRKRVVRSK